MNLNEVDVLRWLHILSMVYWLGGEWGVFQSSFNILNPKLPLEERRRHMETAYRIDVLARTGIISLLPLGLHMGHIYGLQPLGGAWLTGMWIAYAAWFTLVWAAFLTRETDLGLRLTNIDTSIRYVVIPVLFYVGISSLLGHGPLTVGQGTMWYAAKMTLYAFTLVIGLGLRYIMKAWTLRFRVIAATPGGDPAQEAALEREFGYGRMMAYVYWVTIAGICFLGAVKPF